MSERKFKFVSPGVFIKEIDQSQIPESPAPAGPVVIGRSQRGPGMTPIKVSSFSEFVETFGAPYSQQAVQDPWRTGNKAGTTYGAYAAKAWLRNSNNLTFIRVLGTQSPDASSDAERAGWNANEALGLFVFGSGSSTTTTTNHTGTLAAIIYPTTAVEIGLSGTFLDIGTAGSGNAAAIKSINAGTSATSAEFKLQIDGEVGRASDGSTLGSYIFNFNPNSKKFIRKVLNTDPVKTNTSIYSNSSTTYKKYFLGETFEYSLDDLAGDSYFAMIVRLVDSGSPSTADGKNFRYPAQKSETGWFIGQDLNENTSSYNPEDMPKLFKLRARTGGKWLQNNLKVSIDNMRYGRISGSYGSFDVVLRQLDDTDNVLQTVERFSNLNLDPTSPNYIARKIGDKYVSWDGLKLVNKDIGQYANQSKFVYVEMEEGVAAGTVKPELLPFGVFGPLRYEDSVFLSGSDAFVDVGGSSMDPFIGGQGSVSNGATATAVTGTTVFGGYATGLTFDFPDVPLRASGSSGGQLDITNAFWGAYTGRTNANAIFAADILDLVKPRPRGLLADPNSEDNQAAEVADLTQFMWVFSLDNVSASFSGYRVMNAGYAPTFRTAGASVTAVSNQSYKTLIDKNLARFTSPFAGGSDGFDITEKAPALREGLFTNSTYSAYNTAQRAIDLLTDPENVAFNVATFPGLKQPALTKRLMEKCEDRADALAIIDVEKAFVPPSERTSTQTAAPTADDTLGNVDTAISTFTDRQLDSSYGCAYYPWVQALDEETNQVVYLPPSVVALGVMSKTDADRGPWFAPAGFNRGGLSSGDAGIPVLATTEKLTSKDRDNLYEVGLNPLATFPNEGVVVFGQKTLQADRSALDRINVRRMLIYVKSGISQIASGFLFEPNVQDTWNRFLAEAEPFLTDVQQQFGIDEFKLTLDNTTTTPDLIDQNILYAKLFIKPTRAIEFIAVDFFITNSGASFED
tara:strand:+ start:3664 stop:6564 length:2901 start_codon:yes stop_codon:yes gene_type:complete